MGSVKNAVEKIVLEKDRIDVLVNNAGYDLAGAIEEISMDEMRSHFETNFFGADALICLNRIQRREISCTWEVGNNALIRVYSKEMKTAGLD